MEVGSLMSWIRSRDYGAGNEEQIEARLYVLWS